MVVVEVELVVVELVVLELVVLELVVLELVLELVVVEPLVGPRRRALVVPNWFPADQLLADADEIPIAAIMATADNTTMTVRSLLVFIDHTDPTRRLRT